MMPGNVLSDTPVRSAILQPDSWQKSALKDFEDGGIAVGNPSQGITGYNWEAWVDPDGNIWAKRVDKDEPTFIINRKGARNIGLAFDRSMNVAISYQIGTDTFLYWYDPSVSGYVTSQFSGISPAITHDDKRFDQSQISDILLFYIRANRMYMRVQRDRYLIEYNLTAVNEGYEIQNVGMGTNLRLQFTLAPPP